MGNEPNLGYEIPDALIQKGLRHVPCGGPQGNVEIPDALIQKGLRLFDFSDFLGLLEIPDALIQKGLRHADNDLILRLGNTRCPDSKGIKTT